MGKQWKQCQTLFFWAPKSLQMVTEAMKLKDAYSLVSGEIVLGYIGRRVDGLTDGIDHALFHALLLNLQMYSLSCQLHATFV